MRIKKKTPKPSSRRPPLYFVGYRGVAPATDELKAWYDKEYGGPLAIHHEAGSAESWQATHGPWSAHVVMPLPMSHVADVMKQLAWEHDVMGAVAPSLVSPRETPDTILFAARLAKGLTLLSQGTAHDIVTNQYVNPSDWQDRSLAHFVSADQSRLRRVRMNRAIGPGVTRSASVSSGSMNLKYFSPLVSRTSPRAIYSGERQTN